MMEDWYNKYIEPEIRSIVRFLRDNGCNTQSSCGHKMTVQCDYVADGMIKNLDDLLFNAGYRDYDIVITLHRTRGHLYPMIDISFKRGGEVGYG